MNKTTKTLFAVAALAGLSAGALATKAHAEDAGKPADKAAHTDKAKEGCNAKDGCKAREGCKSKDGCKAKDGCKSKDGCHAKKDGEKTDHKADGHQDGEKK